MEKEEKQRESHTYEINPLEGNTRKSLFKTNIVFQIMKTM